MQFWGPHADVDVLEIDDDLDELINERVGV